ncbi:GDP-fucose synthetase [Prochlorococcus marinus str. XMU1401]|uniref:GDP-L-fucose synthase n=1 Tax=Prochlorococcus marinus str. XMU1401 TaxID=2052594 RepID=A0A8I1X3S6_PROMR|nr:GDP-L-fucose synthase [Prochlorococcus marinus]MBO8223303.1 GDP-L-fucose synthase [Prochlorococcus marinus str. XMU1401]MBW3059836.1 GDP-fucose synthetase [Prochlorococcus marinus str. XMU1401E]PJC83649.1 GDP-fucose synthetase [Prochlorococcus marinus str. XMU1401]
MLLNKKDKIFVAGHNGMLGKSLVSRFLAEGFTNLLTVNKKQLNLSDYEKTDDFIKKESPDIVVICAAKVGGIKANIDFPADYLLENLKIQNSIIESSFRNNVRRLLFIGSSCIYPKFAKQPIVEEALLTSSLEPTLEPYALAKITGLKMCEALRRQYDFDTICLMPSNLYGPGDNFNENNSHVLPSLIRKFHFAKEANSPYLTCWGSGNVLREFLYVDDLSDAILVALKEWDPSLKGAPKQVDKSMLTYLNVGVGKDISIKELANLIANVVGYRGEIRWDLTKKDGTPRKLLDISRIKKLGWLQKTKLNDGLKITYDYFLKSLSEGSIRL